ncbi:glucuronate isomerase [Catalinimonas alkaloidigena]|uniref:Uronate isomerase n=1 Tax=Catalinimonas alkaloidigena TaxID=1075417 RepID=A0A1G9H883_9BACT|nr:glucuronate isomerase [Catalinimonas alkaloidigena]SDL09166.1 glucuronate isomerase [Catalinimonas alkaloidigena]
MDTTLHPAFLDEDFLLHTETARALFHDFAKEQPIIDYHCHLPPEEVAKNRQFKNLTQIWLAGDHYKWRAMRANGIDERYCTGDADDYAKFEKWAETVPYTMRNPLYHWTHMELKRPFGVERILKPETARSIYDACTEKLQTPEFRARGIMEYFDVRVVCTTDDPADSLDYHKQVREDGFGTKMLPTFRADKAMAVENAEAYNAYLEKLSAAAGMDIQSYDDLLETLKKRHDFFAEMGGKLSDHGLEQIYADDYTDAEARQLFSKVRGGQSLSKEEIGKLKSAILFELALLDHSKGWTQQFHLGALRNNNQRMMRTLGPDTGFDSIGDFSQAQAMSKFFSRLDNNDQLAKTIVYNLNPSDNYMFATMMGNFNDGSIAGKMQFGSGWWFLDQKEAMEWQMNALSHLGLLSRFVGMLTDSRSFLSYPRHDYFRRILCNLLGDDVEAGLLPASEINWIGQLVERVCYKNANEFFGF